MVVFQFFCLSMHVAHPITIVQRNLIENLALQSVVLFFWLVFLYMEIPLAISNTKSIPSVPLLLMLPLLWPVIRRGRHKYIIAFGTLLFAAALFSSLFASASMGLSVTVLRLAQYAYSIFLACITFAYVVQLKEKQLQNVLLVICMTMVAGILLERIGLLAPATAAFRRIYEGTSFGGEMDFGREQDLVGFVRPIFFTSEPSLVGLGFYSFACSFLVVNKRVLFDVLAPLFILVVFMALGSPSILLALVFWLLVVIVKYQIRFVWWFILLVSIVILVWLAIFTGWADGLWYSLAFRFQEELFEEGTSLYSRIFVPYGKTVPLTLKEHPLFGVGYGNHAAVSALFGYKGELDAFESQFIIGSNALANIVTYMGIVGFAAAVGGIIWLGKKFRYKSIFLLIGFWVLLGQIIGTFSPPRFWCYSFLFFAAFIHFEKTSAVNDQL